ncbi:tRNA (adenosine(37)-N6)-threonylcarbamoyltransferase complex dimerization subunit type 1 TsaB [Clostridium minihomine]|uniref:tRNA (adenosine(37)-N6)-threonylcarbamoyltransferase complex dimerization subunit type 1 TsaB n=1 Tax=Clostridium minihomine TaxID=2045012 RepID=UPI000C792080|nr:tRNA (adenosine(37)-N6)-threonylcarbamoyltransferase complex dimerization subunit type 1 TsaB [Clostridium minihomine]
MKILAIDSTAVAASAAVMEDDRLLGEFFIHTKQTHSQTLMPMVQQVLDCTGISINEIDLFAAAAGPGSFTGVRIGVACVKGMAMAQNKPCVGVSTLEAMAYNLSCPGAVVCAVMDARREQVYNALFQLTKDGFQRLTPDRAISIEDLAQECKNFNSSLFLVGDGAKLCYNTNGFQELSALLPPEPSLYQRAFGVGKAAYRACLQGQAVPAGELLPVYLRLPQAERELKKRLENQKED